MERRLTAILSADVVGYSRLMGVNETGTLAELKSLRAEFINDKIAEHQGRIVKLTGDGMLAEFPSVVSAVTCAVEMQKGFTERMADVPPDRRFQFRIGINLDDVIVEGADIYGDGVNVAARLESIARPGCIAISQSVRDQVGNRLDCVFEDMGEQELKNIGRPVRVYSISPGNFGTGNSQEAKSPPPDPLARPSIAVLPFNNMSDDPEQEYFSDGITEDIITDLSKISGLVVVPRHTAFTYKGKPVKVQQLGQELGVGFILEGSVRKAGSRLRVTGQLVRVDGGAHVWADRFDRELTDIFQIQDEITHAIVEQLKVKLRPQEKKSLGHARTENVEAYTYYLRGRELLHHHSKSYYELARRMFVKAVELDPLYARAYAGIADCDSSLYLHCRVDIGIDNLLATTEKALALDNKLPEAHASRGVALSAAGRDEEAEKEFEQALVLDPNSFETHYSYARVNFKQGKVERAAEHFERACAIRPDDYQPVCLLIHVYRGLGRYEDSKRAARKGIRLAERALALHPEDPRPSHLGLGALIELGETDRAREWIARALAIDPDAPLTQYNVACGLTKLGDIDAALDLLERSVPRLGPELTAWLKHDSDFEALRSHPRYQKILEQIL